MLVGVARREPRYAACLIFDDGIMIVACFASAAAASAIVERLCRKLGVPQRYGCSQIGSLGNSPVFAAIGLPTVLAEIILVVVVPVWLSEGGASRAAAPLIVLAIDLVAQELLVWAGRRASAQLVRDALSGE